MVHSYWQDYRRNYWQVYRQVASGTPVVLTRPEDVPRTVWLNAQPRDLAYASIAAGRARFPVDAAVWLCLEVACTIDLRHLDDVLPTIRMPRIERVPDEYQLWSAQLRDGSSWHEPRLPQITMPAALAQELTSEIIQAGVEIAACPALLSAVLYAEAAAVSNGGQRLRDVLAAVASVVVTRTEAA